MMRIVRPAWALLLLVTIPGAAGAQELDEVILKDGSKIVGTVKEMLRGVLIVDHAFGIDQHVKVNWADVASLKTGKPLPFLLEDGTTVMGTAAGGQGGNLEVRSESLPQPAIVPLMTVEAINKKLITLRANLSLGAAVSDGNTQNRTGSLLGEFETRTDLTRLTLRGAYNYAEDDDGVTVRNGRVGLKFDYFITKRFYVYASSLFEYDAFQDLNLRTALSAGPGYQFIDKGDFTADYLRELQLYGEIGVSYFSEDYDDADDQSYVSGRWAARVDWPFLPGQITFFHLHEGYPGFENLKDLYITTEQGLRFTINKYLIATLQVNWRWDNTPAPGREREDTLYLMTVGFNWDA